MVDFFDVIRKRWSCRSFSRIPIPEDHLTLIVECGWRAPTAFTIQPWHFIIVTESQLLTSLSRVQGCIQQASAAVVACANPSLSDFWREDLAAAMENMHLAATALGYASLWVAVLDKSVVSPVLEISPPWVPMGILAIGGWTSPGSQASRKPVQEVLSWNRFGH